jgi:NAD(P)-dependent dehydrogenase (short-subunit alcohol dehydrogenase family)
MTRFALPHLQKTRGNVICAGSEAGWMGLPEVTAYGGTKAFLHAFMKGVAVEQARHGVRANCVCPGNVATDLIVNDEVLGMFRPDLDRPTVADAAPVFSSMVPLTGQPLLQPGDVSEAVLWLASDEARWVTGAVLAVDMGMTSR